MRALKGVEDRCVCVGNCMHGRESFARLLVEDEGCIIIEVGRASHKEGSERDWFMAVK